MRSALPPTLLALLLLTPAGALARDAFCGVYRLEGHDSNQGQTEVSLLVSEDGAGGLEVRRVAEYTSGPQVGRRDVVWTSGEVRIQGRLMRVTYRPEAEAASGGLTAALNPDALGAADALAALGATCRLEALYVRSADVASLREYVVNQTRVAPETGWSWISTRGARLGGVVPDVTFTTSHPGASVERVGDHFVLRSDPSGAQPVLGERATASLGFDGHVVDLRPASHSGTFSVYDLPSRVPEGYLAERLEGHRVGDVWTETFVLRRAPDSLTTRAAIRAAHVALVDYLRTTRIHEADWRRYCPSTWAEVVDAGVLQDLDAFFSDPATEVYRETDRIGFVGRGPFQLYTEVWVSRTDGSFRWAYVEID